MNRGTVTAALVAGGVCAAALTACGGTNQERSGPGMMGGSTGGTYRHSRLACSAPDALPGSRVTVTLTDMGMSRMMGGTASLGQHMMLRSVPATVAAGQVSLVAQNMGWRTHELVILPLRSGVAGQHVPSSDGKINESGSLGEASADCAAGSGEGIPSGSVGWTTVTLRPGRYELVCNLPNHYANGMRQELDVTAAP